MALKIMTFSITTVSITTFRIMALIIKKFSITTVSITTFSIMTCSATTFSLTKLIITIRNVTLSKGSQHYDTSMLMLRGVGVIFIQISQLSCTNLS
jgi:hypothetical protein